MIDITIKNNLGESRVSFSFWVTVIIKGSQGRKLSKQRRLRNSTDWLDPMAFSCSYASQHHPPKMAPHTRGWASQSCTTHMGLGFQGGTTHKGLSFPTSNINQGMLDKPMERQFFS